jgi:predicted GNAT family acetyltransferase
MSFRHLGLGDKLVNECLDWAKESGTLVIPTCAFVKRHLEHIGSRKYDSILYPLSSFNTTLKNSINNK